MKKSLTALLLFVLTVPALAAPFSLRSEVAVSEPVYAAVREFSRSGVRLATDGNDYLAVWTDSREGGEHSLYAARIRADGTVLDPLGIRIANNAEAGPVVWTGSKYLLAYEQGYGYQAYVRTMTPDGEFGEPREVGRYVTRGAMATNGTNVLLVLSEEAMLLDVEGNKLKSVALAARHSYPRVAAAGGTYLVASALPDVSVQTVSSDGTAGALQQLAAPDGLSRVDVATDGDRFLVIWADHQIKAQLVTRAGLPDGPVRTLAYKRDSNWPRVAWVDGEYLVVFSEPNEPAHYTVRVARDGTLKGDPTYPTRLGRDLEPDVEIVARGRSGIVMFRGLRAALFDDDSLDETALFRRVVDVGITARPQTNVHLARIDDGYVTAWEEDGRVFLSTAAGTTPVAVVGSQEKLVDVLVDHSNVIWVIWATESDFYVARYWPSLEAIDAQPLWISVPGGRPYATTAAAGNGVIALAYEVSDPEAAALDVAALLLWETGSGLARRDVLLTTQTFADFSPAVAFDGNAFVYGWFHAKAEEPPFPQPAPPTELVAARVSLDGDLLDATPVRLADDAGSWWQIDAARGANGVAFAWQAGEGSTRLALFGGSSVVELEGAGRALGELAPHNGGFLLVRGISRRTPALTEVEYLVLGADLSIAAAGALPPYTADNYFKDFDIDVIGGPSPVFAYAKSANDSKYGHVPRVFVRKTGEVPPRRRALR